MYHYRQTSLSLPQARDPSCVSNAMDSQPGIFVLAQQSVRVWQVQHQANTAKWFSDPTEAQEQAPCFPTRTWHRAQVGPGWVPSTRREQEHGG